MQNDIIANACNEFGTPLYIYNLDELKDRTTMIRNRLSGRAKLCFAMKANPFLISKMTDYIDRFEVCSPGEYEICHTHGIDTDSIIISGVNKTEESMDRIITLSCGKGIYTIESPEHFRILDKLSSKKQLTLDVIIRLSSGNQFGVDTEALEALAKQVIDSTHLKLHGIHFYSGTQKRMSKIEKELSVLSDMALHLKDIYGLDNLELEYGPGLPVSYFESDSLINDDEVLSNLAALLDNVKGFSHITLEMGRYIAAYCGYYVSTVMDVKRTDGHNYCIIDGGIHQINYYGQLMGMKRPVMTLLNTADIDKSVDKYNICGSLCTVNDILVKDAEFPQINVGDRLIFKNCGAYSITEGMALFLSRDLPKAAFYSEKDGFKILRNSIETAQFNTFKEER